MNGDDVKRRTISMDVLEDDPVGIVWADHEHRNNRIDPKFIGQHVCAYIEELEDGDEVTLVFRRLDMSKRSLDAIPET